MSIQVNMHEAKTRLSELVEKALNGEEVVIARAGVPCVHLVPHKPQRITRTAGRYKGQLWIADDFDETPQDIIDAFEGKE